MKNTSGISPGGREGDAPSSFRMRQQHCTQRGEAGHQGNEKVLRARLSDAAYFFQEDLKVPLEKRVEQLRKVVFQAKLGTSYEKMERFRSLASFFAERVDPKLRETVERVCFLCRPTL